MSLYPTRERAEQQFRQLWAAHHAPVPLPDSVEVLIVAHYRRDGLTVELPYVEAAIPDTLGAELTEAATRARDERQ